MEFLTSLKEYFSGIPRWQKWLGIALLGLVLYAFFYFLQIVPLKEKVATLEKRRNSLLLTVNRLKVVEKRRDSLRKEIFSLEKQIEELENKLPTGKERVDQIIKSISVADSKMEILEIKRLSPKEKKYFVEVPYRVVLKGTYLRFLNWCKKLSSSDRIFAFGDISIQSLQPTGNLNRNSKDTVRVNMVVKAFNLKR